MEILLEEYTCRFHALLEMSYKLDAQEALEQIKIISLPNYKNQSDIDRVISTYQKQASMDEPREPIISVLKGRRNGPKKKPNG